MTLLVGFVILLGKSMSEQVSSCPTLVLHAEEHQWFEQQEKDEQFLTQIIHVTAVYFCTKMSPAGLK